MYPALAASETNNTATRSLWSRIFQRWPFKPNGGSRGPQNRHQFLAIGAKLFRIEISQRRYLYGRLQSPDYALGGLRQLRSTGFDSLGEDDPIRQLDAIGVALHVVERGSAQPRLSAIRLVATDLKGQTSDTVEQTLGLQWHVVNLRLQIRQVSDQGVGFFSSIGAARPE